MTKTADLRRAGNTDLWCSAGSFDQAGKGLSGIGVWLGGELSIALYYHHRHHHHHHYHDNEHTCIMIIVFTLQEFKTFQHPTYLPPTYLPI